MKKLNYHTVQQMREQYKYAKERLKTDGAMSKMLEYETILWERHIDAGLRGDDVKKGAFPEIVDLMLYKKVKEAWTTKMQQEKEKDGKS